MTIPPIVRKLHALIWALGAVTFVVPAPAALATTAPNVVYHVPVLLTDGSILIAKDRFRVGNTTRYPRGSVIDFVIKNTGREPLQVDLKIPIGSRNYGGLSFAPTTSAGKPIAPGTVRHLEIDFFLRGLFALQSVAKGKVRSSLPIVVF
jgi:hypothetical protein